MSTLSIPLVETPRTWSLPDRGKVAMAGLIIAESAIFTIFVVAYLFYVGKSLTGPKPAEVLETPIFYTVCLLSSSVTIHLSERFLKRDRMGAFLVTWFFTFLLGFVFLFGTGLEWHKLIYEDGLTISTNLFGTTYYSLVGLHAFHLTVGLVMLLIVMLFGLTGHLGREQTGRIGVISMYWHFVDAVWVVVFVVVYMLGR